MLGDNLNASSLFDERFFAGFTYQKEYEERFFVLRGMRHYAVGDAFRDSGVSHAAAIGSVLYELDLGHCADFERKSCSMIMNLEILERTSLRRSCGRGRRDNFELSAFVNVAVKNLADAVRLPIRVLYIAARVKAACTWWRFRLR